MSLRSLPLLVLAGSLSAFGASLSPAAQAVLPQATRQVISLDYHRLANDPTAQQLEAQLLPPQVRGLEALLQRGGISSSQDLNRLTFATYQGDKGIGLIGIAEGNLGDLKLTRFYTRTAKQPNPPQVDGVNVYSSGDLSFFMLDNATMVFGARKAIEDAIATEQGAARIGANEEMTNLIAGTQSSDVWSVLDAAGARAMVRSLIGGSVAGLDPSLIEKRFNGARYTIAFEQTVQLNMELMTSDALSAAAVSTGLNAAVALRSKQEANPAVKALLQQVQVDSAGDHAFLQVSTAESDLPNLMKSDLMQTIIASR